MIDGEALGWKTTNLFGSAAGLITLDGYADGWKSIDLFGSASGMITFDGSASGAIDYGTFTVEFKDYDGTVLSSELVGYGESATAPSNPTRTGYTFAGWDDLSYVFVESDLVITATYTANTYIVYFNPNTGSVSPTSKTVTFGSAYGSLPTPTRTGYTFNGWFTLSIGGTEVTSATVVTTASNHTIYAQWTRNQYTVTFYDWDGTNLGSDTVYEGENATAPTLSPRTGYTFTGWNPAITNVTSSFTTYAQYTADTYTIYYDANGGTGAPSSQTKTYNVTLTLSSTIPTRSGYNFTGWNTSADGSGTSYSAGGSYTTNAGATLYAQWTAQSATSWTSTAFTNYNYTMNYVSSTISCPTEASSQAQLPSASGYPVGTIYRIRTYTNEPDLCATYYFIAV